MGLFSGLVSAMIFLSTSIVVVNFLFFMSIVRKCADDLRRPDIGNSPAERSERPLTLIDSHYSPQLPGPPPAPRLDCKYVDFVFYICNYKCKKCLTNAI